MLFTRLETPIGELLLFGDGESLTRLGLPGRHGPVGDATEDRGAFAEPIAQLERYFSGELREFDLALAPAGAGEFDRAVWDELQRIPYGRTTSYGAVAAAIGHPDSPRAVGAANGRNPIPIVVPCHRVIGAGGKLVGYGGGLEAKRRLLELEAGTQALL
ncbi:MAG TPA: methylated-DNA--[protein]-cysteine S-methyltransferase [Thermoleophilaceae bacterium]|nr:methylated-DNA--[protein]-cysteine S-methyltransferase [Thermoleophilaceae bacterium]